MKPPIAPVPSHLAGAYRSCSRITRSRSSSYWIATAVLPRRDQPYVHSLYAFARSADDIVDQPGDDPRADLAGFRAAFHRAVLSGTSEDPVLAAIAHTIATWRLPVDAFDRFFGSMEMDLSVTSYETWEDLLAYMDGSAAVIGELMLPILGPRDPDRAFGPARDLGLAFQLTNFLRDIDEDLDRGRQYVPQADLRRFGVDLTERRASPAFVDLMRFEIERCRSWYRSADEGIAELPPRSARCIRLARDLYEAILDRIEGHHHDVFGHRARVPPPSQASLAIRAFVRH